MTLSFFCTSKRQWFFACLECASLLHSCSGKKAHLISIFLGVTVPQIRWWICRHQKCPRVWQCSQRSPVWTCIDIVILVWCAFQDQQLHCNDDAIFDVFNMNLSMDQNFECSIKRSRQLIYLHMYMPASTRCAFFKGVCGTTVTGFS